MNRVTIQTVDILDVYFDRPLLDQIEEVRWIVQYTQRRPHPERIEPRLQLRNLGVLAESASIDKISLHVTPESTHKPSSKHSLLQEVSRPSEAIDTAPDTRREPLHESRHNQLLKL